MRDAPAASPPAGLARDGAHAAPDRTDHRDRTAPRGDEDELYRRHHRDLHRAVARAVSAPRELIEDACQTAWTILLRSQPDRDAIFAWLRVVAIHEAYRLSAIDRRDARLERLRSRRRRLARGHRRPALARRRARGARGAPRLGALPERQRSDLALKVAGYSYEEIRAPRPADAHTPTSTSPS